MGKQSRRKRVAPAAPQHITNLVDALYRSQDEATLRAGYKELIAALAQEKAQAAIERVNQTLLGDPVNAHKIGLTFDPIGALLDQIEGSGDIDVDRKGAALFYDRADACWYPLVPGLTAVCDTFVQLAQEFGWTDRSDGLRKLTAKIDVQMPLFQADLEAARASVGWMRAQIATITPQQFSAEAITVQIRDALRLAAERAE